MTEPLKHAPLTSRENTGFAIDYPRMADVPEAAIWRAEFKTAGVLVTPGGPQIGLAIGVPEADPVGDVLPSILLSVSPANAAEAAQKILKAVREADKLTREPEAQ